MSHLINNLFIIRRVVFVTVGLTKLTGHDDCKKALSDLIETSANWHESKGKNKRLGTGSHFFSQLTGFCRNQEPRFVNRKLLLSNQ